MHTVDHSGSVICVTSEHGLSYTQSLTADGESAGTTDDVSVPPAAPARLEPLSGSLVDLGSRVLDPVLRRVFSDDGAFVTRVEDDEGSGATSSKDGAPSNGSEGHADDPHCKSSDDSDRTATPPPTDPNHPARHTLWVGRNLTNATQNRFTPYSKPTRLSIDMLSTYIPGNGSFSLQEARAASRVMKLTPEVRRFPPASTMRKNNEAGKMTTRENDLESRQDSGARVMKLTPETRRFPSAWTMRKNDEAGKMTTRENDLQSHQDPGARIMKLTPEKRRFPSAWTMRKDEAGKMSDGISARIIHESPAATPCNRNGSPSGSTDSSATTYALRPGPGDLGRVLGIMHPPMMSFVPDEDDGGRSCTSSTDSESESDSEDEEARKALYDLLPGPSSTVSANRGRLYGNSTTSESFTPAGFKDLSPSPPRVMSFIPDARRFPPAKAWSNKRKRGEECESDSERRSQDGADGVDTDRKKRRLLPSPSKYESAHTPLRGCWYPRPLSNVVGPGGVDNNLPTTPACRRSHSEPPSPSYSPSPIPRSRVPVIWETPASGRTIWYSNLCPQTIRGEWHESALNARPVSRAGSEETQAVHESEGEDGVVCEDVDVDLEGEEEDVILDRVLCKLERYVETSERDVARWMGLRDVGRAGRRGGLGTGGRDE